ncbi:MAG: Rdx family protein [Actinomycetota bacterium]|nr:Rdx family protein [Actinomycetota bacterium]
MSDLTLVPSRGGVFEVEVDGRLVFSKKATGRHGEFDEILTKIREGA